MLSAAWLREVRGSALSQRVTSAMTLLVVLGATAAVLVTAGRAAGTEAAVLADIDAAGTRTLTIETTILNGDFSAQLIGRLARHRDVIEEVTGLGPVEDVTASAYPGGRVAMRSVYGSLSGSAVEPLTPVAGTPQVLATQDAIDVLGLRAGRGSVSDTTQKEAIITGRLTLPEHLAWMGPSVVVPGDLTSRDPLTTIVVVAREPADLPLITALVLDAVGDVGIENLTIETSQQLADLRTVIGGELSRQSRTLVLSIIAASGLAIMLNIWGVALMRRKDLGRRRALGATRTMIVSLLTAQVGLLAALGALGGLAIGTGFLYASGNPLPSTIYLAAVVATFTATAVAVAALPACWAANRDPLQELRVP